MFKFSHPVGDTVTLSVKVDNLSDDYSEAALDLHRRNSSQGLQDLIKSVPVDSRDGDDLTFVYNTEDITHAPKNYYGHFHVDNNGIMINTYYKIRATY